MVDVTFYEKPGCINNSRQKKILAASGHRVFSKNLMTEPLSSKDLLAFLQQLPVSSWFNQSAPRIKSGEIDPLNIDANTALALMLEDRLLIRRPLMKTGNKSAAGFDQAEVDRWIGLLPETNEQDYETCTKSAPEAGAVTLDSDAQ
jgi:nitrogenase-associated protein